MYVSEHLSLPGRQPAACQWEVFVSSPDTGCLYYSVYYWHSATQLSSDLWIGMVCICTQMSSCLVPRQKYSMLVFVCIFTSYSMCVCVCMGEKEAQKKCVQRMFLNLKCDI